MNSKALEILEYNQILETIETMAVSKPGKILIKNIQPSNDLNRITNQLKEVDEAKAILNTTSAVPLQDMVGIEGILDKLSKDIMLNIQDLTAIATMLSGIKRLKSFMDERADIAPMVSGFAASMFALPEVIEEIHTCIYNNRIDDRASNALEKIRKRMYVAEGRIKSKLDSYVKSTSYKKYLQDSNISVKNDRYVISVKSEYKHQISGTVITKSTTGSTLFIEPTVIGQLQNELDLLKMDEEREIYQILMYLTSLVSEHQQSIRLNIETLSYYDFLFAKAKYSQSISGRTVSLNLKGFTSIIQGRHPLLGTDAVPLDFYIGKDYRSLVITGPNTGGKTVVLKTVGLLTTMVQSGLHVPVDPSSEFAIFSDVLVDIGDGQSIEQSLSTFSSHVKNIINIMKCANPYTLVLLDEIGAGTDPIEGEGLAVSILEELYSKGSTIVSTSHYGEVKSFASNKEGFKNGKMIFDLNSLKPTYVLDIGKPGESNAFIIALRLGMSQAVIENAHKITYKEEKDYSEAKLQQKSTIPEDNYKKVKRPRSIKKQMEQKHKNERIDTTVYQIGDVVYVHSLKRRGIVFELENKKQEVGVKISDKKMFVHRKRLSLFIERQKLYPDADNYDYKVVTETVDYRKKNHQMSRKFNKDIEIIHKKGRDL